MVDPIIYSDKSIKSDSFLLSDEIVDALKSVKDPEIPVDIY